MTKIDLRGINIYDDAIVSCNVRIFKFRLVDFFTRLQFMYNCYVLMYLPTYLRTYRYVPYLARTTGFENFHLAMYE